MDRVRFGRALGEGARATAKALWRAGEAAGAPSPETRTPVPQRPAPAVAAAERQEAARRVQAASRGVEAASRRVGAASERVSGAGRELGRSVLRPAIRISGVVWLEVTGSLFALFAFGAAIETWRTRAALWPLGAHQPEQSHALFGVAILLVFGFFSVSNFLRAARRARS